MLKIIISAREKEVKEKTLRTSRLIGSVEGRSKKLRKKERDRGRNTKRQKTGGANRHGSFGRNWSPSPISEMKSTRGGEGDLKKKR